jgi:copper(I)-binding protein
MKRFGTALFVLALGAMTAAPPAQEFTAGAIKVGKAWTREVPAGAKVAVGFMTIANTGKEPDTLVGGSIPLAGKFEVHEMKMDSGIMQMRRLVPGLTLEPGETVVLRPGSFHVMFMDLKQGPKRGTPVKGTLIFEKAGKIEVEYSVEGLGARDLGAPTAKPGAK